MRVYSNSLLFPCESRQLEQESLLILRSQQQKGAACRVDTAQAGHEVLVVQTAR